MRSSIINLKCNTQVNPPVKKSLGETKWQGDWLLVCVTVSFHSICCLLPNFLESYGRCKTLSNRFFLIFSGEPVFPNWDHLMPFQETGGKETQVELASVEPAVFSVAKRLRDVDKAPGSLPVNWGKGPTSHPLPGGLQVHQISRVSWGPLRPTGRFQPQWWPGTQTSGSYTRETEREGNEPLSSGNAPSVRTTHAVTETMSLAGLCRNLLLSVITDEWSVNV